MKVLLINPICYNSLESFLEDSRKMKINSDENLGLMYISSYLKQQLPEVEIEIFDWHLQSLKELYNYKNQTNIKTYDWIEDNLYYILRREITDYNPDVIGISMLYEFNSDICLEMIKEIKSFCPNAILVVGGLYATTFKDELSENENIDYIIEGEGEIKFVNLINDLYCLNNTLYIKDEYIKNLDDLSFPDRNNLPIGYYSIYGRQVSDRIYKENCKTVTIQISRGCPLKCVYCSGHGITNRDYRIRSVQNIVEEIKYLKKNYNPEIFNFNEENPNINIKHTKELYKAFIPLNIKWISNAGFYVSNLDQEFVELAMKSGLIFWNLAIESGSERMLKIMKKPTNIPEKAKQVVKWIREIDNFIYLNSFWLFGFAEENWEDINESIKLMKELDIDWYQINFLNIHRGSELYDRYRDQGLIEEIDNKDGHYLESKVKNIYGIDRKEISDYVYQKVNIDLNFKNNRCVRIGNYEQVKRDMKHILNITDGKHKWANKIMEKLNNE